MFELCSLVQDNNYSIYTTGQQKEEDGKTFVCDKRDRAITCMSCRYVHLTLMFFGL